MSNSNRTIKEEVRQLGRRKRALSYVEMVTIIQARHPEANTTVKTVQWYASRLRREGEAMNVKDGREAGRARKPANMPGDPVDETVMH